MKKFMKKIGVCLFTIAVLFGTVPVPNVKATDNISITLNEAMDIIQNALTEKISNAITEQEMNDIALEALKGKSILEGGEELKFKSVVIETKQEATENSVGELKYKVYWIDTGGSNPDYSNVLSIPRMPKEDEVAINETNFPDKAFREYVKDGFDRNPTDGVLSVSELQRKIKMEPSGNLTIKSLKGIEYFTALEMLYCWGISIESLDVTNNKKLTFINCRDNQKLTSLNITGLESLEALAFDSTAIKELDIRSNKKLKGLRCIGADISQLDVSNNLELLMLQCSNTKITELDLSKNKALQILDVDFTNIDELDISANLALEQLYCSDTNIKRLDVSQHKNLSVLSCADTPLAYLNIGNNEKLTALNKTDSTVNLDVIGSTFSIREAFKGIDPQKMTMISGGQLDKETGMISDYQIGTPIVYRYHCGTSGNGEETMQVTLHLNVVKGNSIITLNKDLNKTYDGQPIELSKADITVTGSLKPITLIYEEKIEDEWVKLESTPSKIGTYRVKIGVAEDEFYHSAEVVQEFTIQVAEIKHGVPPTGDKTSTYIGAYIGVWLMSVGIVTYNTKRKKQEQTQ